MHVAHIHRELRRQWARHELRECQSFFVVGIGDPPAFFDEIPIHVSDERDGTAKADAAQLQEVKRELGQRVRRTIGHRFSVKRFRAASDRLAEREPTVRVCTAGSTHAPPGSATRCKEQNLDAVSVFRSRGVCLLSPGYIDDVSAMTGAAQPYLTAH